ncbi:uncharacterized protein [Arachis hypogaea]|uniref:uncharacterized protein isoform X2 n=1 Tax=Arachis hypogaea TaxID=3818 RepID=UPI003B222B78
MWTALCMPWVLFSLQSSPRWSYWQLGRLFRQSLASRNLSLIRLLSICKESICFSFGRNKLLSFLFCYYHYGCSKSNIWGSLQSATESYIKHGRKNAITQAWWSLLVY